MLTLTLKKRWIIPAVAGAMTMTGLVLAQSGTAKAPALSPGGSGPSSTAAEVQASGGRGTMQEGQKTTLTGRLVTVREYVTGQSMAYGNSSSSGMTNRSSPSGTVGTASTSGTYSGSSASGAGHANGVNGAWHDRMSMVNEPLALVDTNGGVVILGQSWSAAEKANWHSNSGTAGSAGNMGTAGNMNNGSSASGTVGTAGTAGNMSGSSMSGSSKPINRLSQATSWLDQQVRITGMLYTKSGIRYLDVHTVGPEAAAALPQKNNELGEAGE